MGTPVNATKDGRRSGKAGPVVHWKSETRCAEERLSSGTRTQVTGGQKLGGWVTDAGWPTCRRRVVEWAARLRGK